MNNNNKLYKCNKCDNIYISYKSLWSHNKLKHTINNIKTITKQAHNNQPLNIIKKNNLIECNFCKQIFTHINNKYRHEKICKTKINNTIEDKQL
jgi:hypothetical protein